MNNESTLFAELEQLLFRAMIEQLRRLLTEVLSRLDDYLYNIREVGRYVVLDRESRVLETLCGVIQFERRCYRDKVTGKRVYLLDERLGLKSHTRVGPGLAAVAISLAASGPSYRSARDQLKFMYGSQVLSHEGIRQLTIDAGSKALAAEDTVSATRKKLPVVFLEVDGVNSGRQAKNTIKGKKKKRKKKESKVAIIYEGWRNRYGSSKEYELVNKVRIIEHGSSDRLWRRVRAKMEALYEDLDDTMVVMNGDRAPWISSGTDWFGKAIYQCDRYHVQRDLRMVLGKYPELLKAAVSAYERSDVGSLGAVLSKVPPEQLKKTQSECLHRYLEIIRKMPDSFIDYRLRLRGLCYDTTGFRGLGACESNIAVIKARLRGRSWTLRGITGLTGAVVALTNGTLHKFAHHVSITVTKTVDEVVSAAAVETARQLMGDHPPVKRGHLPALDRGTKGYAPLFKQLIHASI